MDQRPRCHGGLLQLDEAMHVHSYRLNSTFCTGIKHVTAAYFVIEF